MSLRHILRICPLVLAFAVAPAVHAQQASQIEELSSVDLSFMAEQRSGLEELAVFNLGRRFTGDRDQDLDLLQTLLDRRLVRPDQTRELQAMGVILGDLLAEEYDMHWVVFRDEAGRSRALRYRETDFVLFPVTMISRRREVGNETPVQDIYRKAVGVIEASTPDRSFQ